MTIESIEATFSELNFWCGRARTRHIFAHLQVDVALTPKTKLAPQVGILEREHWLWLYDRRWVHLLAQLWKLLLPPRVEQVAAVLMQACCRVKRSWVPRFKAGPSAKAVAKASSTFKHIRKREIRKPPDFLGRGYKLMYMDINVFISNMDWGWCPKSSRTPRIQTKKACRCKSGKCQKRQQATEHAAQARYYNRLKRNQKTYGMFGRLP